MIQTMDKFSYLITVNTEIVDSIINPGHNFLFGKTTSLEISLAIMYHK